MSVDQTLDRGGHMFMSIKPHTPTEEQLPSFLQEKVIICGGDIVNTQLN